MCVAKLMLTEVRSSNGVARGLRMCVIRFVESSACQTIFALKFGFTLTHQLMRSVTADLVEPPRDCVTKSRHNHT